MSLKCFEIDPNLPHHAIWDRVNGYKHWKSEFEKNEGGVMKFAESYKVFGMNRNEKDTGFVFREYLPAAKNVFIIGEFNKWEMNMPLKNEGHGKFAIELLDKANGDFMIPHKSKYKMRIESNSGEMIDRVPAWTQLAWQTGDKHFDAAMWYPPKEDRYQFKHPHPPKPSGLKIYEAHVGMCSHTEQVNTYMNFAENILPRIKKLGYNCVQLMAISEHAYYGCFGYHVTSFFAPSSRFGTPEELKYLVDKAHGMGLQVIMDLVHAHASSNAGDGMAYLDGTDHCYMHGGSRGYHTQWDSRLFNFENYETMRFLLSNVNYWIKEFKFDGYRFDGVSSMLYHSHAINVDVHDYFGPDADTAAHIYIMLANDVIKTQCPAATTIAEDVSGMPTLALPIEWGGFGFDCRLAMAVPDMFIKIMKEVSSDEDWSMKWIAGELQNNRKNERSVAYAESHDQAIVGDKTIAFWLMDAEMYTGMSTMGGNASPVIERGLALHKMIRQVCMGMGESYLTFCGNEFGHPEWVDFPREGNGWSYKHAIRRYDLPDQEHLRYKHFNVFDEYMCQVEARFKYLSDWHYHNTLVNEEDKVIVVERGECLLVFNFHPCNAYTDYRIGSKWKEPMRIIMDSDEGRFGGHMRLDWGHANSFPIGDGWMDRNHSIKIYLPPRTCQVLVPESHLKNGITVEISDDFMKNLAGVSGVSSPADLSMTLVKVESAKGETISKEIKTTKFGKDGVIHLDDLFDCVFTLHAPDGSQINCAASFHGHYEVYFPGVYQITGIGVVTPLSPSEISERALAKTPAAAKKAATAAVGAAPAAAGYPAAAAATAAATAADAKSTAEKEAKALSDLDGRWIDNRRNVVEIKDLRANFHDGTNGSLTKITGRADADYKLTLGGSDHHAKQQPGKLVWDDDDIWQKETQVTKEEADKAKAKADKDAKDKEAAAAKKAMEEALVKKATEDKWKNAAPLAVVKETTDFEEMERCRSMHLFGPLDSSAATGMKRQTSPGGTELEPCIAEADLMAVAESYKAFGLHKDGDTWTFREWLPAVKAAFLVGEFNDWKTEATPLKQEAKLEDVWACTIKGAQASAMKNGQKYKLYIVREDGRTAHVTPAWCMRMTYTKELNIMDPVVWSVTPVKQKVVPAPKADRIYECHLGLAKSPKSYKDAADVIIPRAKKNGYTSLCLIGVQECKNYSMMGAQPCGYFAPTAWLGEPEELQAFVVKAHDAGLRVYMSIAHEGAAWCPDGLGDQYFRTDTDHLEPTTGARTFNHAHAEVARYLLSNLTFWMTEYGFDGFHFPRVASMIYTSRGRWLPEDVKELDEYVKTDGNLDTPAIQYLRMANTVVHKQGTAVGKTAITIADESSLFPDLCSSVSAGGLGFDFRQSSAASALFRTLLKKPDEEWGMAEMLKAITKPAAAGGKVILCTEAAKDVVVARKPLKIAFLAWETLHTIAVGGVAPHVTELGAALNGVGHEVHIFTRAQGNACDHEIMGVHYHEVCYDKHSCMVQDIRNMCSAFVAALFGHESTWGQFDIVHGHDWLAGPAIQQLKGAGKKCVFTMHSTEGGRNGDASKGHPKIKEIERGGCGAADQLIAVSGVLKEEIQQLCGADGGRTKVIYNGIHAGAMLNMEWCDEWTGNTKKDMGWSAMDPMFLFVGRHTAQKGCDIFIEAIPAILAKRGDAKFVIVGDGHLFEHNKGRAGALGLNDAICFTGSLKSGSDHLKALFKACDAVVVPSRNEPFGIVVLEAWASGKPVVATTSGGPRDFVKPGEDGYLVDPEPGSVAWGCCKILENFEHARWMGEHACAKAIREFSWDHIAHETEEVYYKLINREGCPRSGDRNSGYPLAQPLLEEKKFQMGNEHNDPAVNRGLSILKMMKLLVLSLGGDAVMTWMGSEFAQIDGCDMPRNGNGHNDDLSRVKYELADNNVLRFSQMEAFEAAVNRTEAACKWLSAPGYKLIEQSEEKKVLAFARGGCVFVFNFNPVNKHSRYSIAVPKEIHNAAMLKCVLNTNDAKFGVPVAVGAAEIKGNTITVDLPPRTALVFAL